MLERACSNEPVFYVPQMYQNARSFCGHIQYIFQMPITAIKYFTSSEEATPYPKLSSTKQ